MTSNAATFGAQAACYAAARPAYPDALFAWVAREAPGRALAWDVGAGSGQATLALATRFGRVQATDLDPAQLEAAPAHPRVAYAAAPAHASGLPGGSADAVTVATALHWFDLPRFWPEVRRAARPGALFAAWTYVWPETDEAARRALVEPVLAVIEPYWSDGNRLCWRGYPPEEIGFPFEPVTPPALACELDWRPAQLASFLRSWSAHLRARRDGHEDALDRIETDALRTLGEAPRRVRLPLAMRAGRVTPGS